MLTDPTSNEKVRSLKAISDELGCTLAQMSLAWCVKNPHVSTVMTGASRVEQVEENMRAIEVVDLLDDAVMQRIDEATR
jgi:aryl-alcohol dehydrogenase-like predicted oxidoreductase